MAKVQAQKKKSSLPILIGVLVVAVIFGLSGGNEAPTTKKKGLGMGAFPTATKKKKGDIEYTQEDEKAKFGSVDTAATNAFKPQIVRRDVNSQLRTGASNGIPPLFAGGEAGWTYTGNMEVNGKPNALLENSGTGEGVFLKPGEKWKALTLVKVNEDSIVLDGPGGYRKTVYFNANTEEAPAEVAPLNPMQPGNPRMAGAIGNGGLMAEQNNLNSLPPVEGFGGNDRQGRRSRRNSQ